LLSSAALSLGMPAATRFQGSRAVLPAKMAGWSKRSCRAELSSLRKQHWRTTTGYGRARARMPTGSALLTDCPNRFSTKWKRVAAGIPRWTSQGAELVIVPMPVGTGSHRPWQVAVRLRSTARAHFTAGLLSSTLLRPPPERRVRCTPFLCAAASPAGHHS